MAQTTNYTHTYSTTILSTYYVVCKARDIFFPFLCTHDPFCSIKTPFQSYSKCPTDKKCIFRLCGQKTQHVCVCVSVPMYDVVTLTLLHNSQRASRQIQFNKTADENVSSKNMCTMSSHICL